MAHEAGKGDKRRKENLSRVEANWPKAPPKCLSHRSYDMTLRPDNRCERCWEMWGFKEALSAVRPTKK